MEARRPQLSLDELEQLKWLLGGLVALFAIWTILYMELDTSVFLLPISGAVVAVMIWPWLPSKIPGWLRALAFPAIVAVFVGDLWLNGEVLPAMIRLNLLLILYRCTGYRARRDELQLLILSLFLVVIAGVLTVSLAFAVQILGFTACALAFLLTLTIADAATAVHPAPRTPWFTWGLHAATPSWVSRADWPHLFGRLRHAADWRLLGLGALLFAGVVGLAALLFLAIPRFQLENSFFFDRLMPRKSRTGFSERIRFGEVTDIINDNSLALSVEVSDPAGVPATPYFRMVVLDEYRSDGFAMSDQLRQGFSRSRPGSVVRASGPGPRDGPVWTFYLEPGISRFMPLPGSFGELRFEGLQQWGLHSRAWVLALQNEPGTMLAYQMRGVATSPTLLDPASGAPQPPLALGPADRATLARVLGEITGGLSPAEAGRLDPADFSQRVSRWLALQHSYSLQSELPSADGDPLVRWLASDTPGHCEYFAGAFWLLAREAGFPVRVVTGFKGGTWNGFTRNLTVRNNNAHAWCEIADGRGGWLRVDPTPGSGAQATAGSADTQRFDSSWSARLDSLRILWYRRVVNFDQGSQMETLRGVVAATKSMSERLRAALDALAQRLKGWIQSPWDRDRIGRGIGLLAAGGALVWAWFWWRRGFRWTWRASSAGRRSDPVRAEAGKWLGRIAERRARHPDIRLQEISGADRVFDDLLRLRYAAPQTWPRPDRVFQTARQVHRSLR